MNDPARNSEPPDEPYLTADSGVLSPASPRPLPFPQPSNIPILENMMDVGFNQTELHMNDPATRNTEIRPDAWRDPNESQPEQPYHHHSDGTPVFPARGDAAEPVPESNASRENGLADTPSPSRSNETAPANGTNGDLSVPLSNGISYQASSRLEDDGTSEIASLDVRLPSSLPTGASNAVGVAHNQPTKLSPDPSHQASSHDEVDVQALLDTLQTSIASSVRDSATPNPQGLTISTALSPSHSQAPPPIPGSDASPLSASGLGAPPSGLPPRPPAQNQPLINSHFVHSQHIRDYHPHGAHSAVQAPSHARSNSQSTTDAPAVGLAPTPSAGSTGYENVQPLDSTLSIQPAPLESLHLQQQFTGVSAALQDSRGEVKHTAGQATAKEDQPWTADIQKKYDHFMEEERRYVNEARWDQFPQGSRLFVGNLSSEKVTKRDIFHVFHIYGELAQISIKQAYGFVQFLRTDDCARAMEAEQGRQIRDKRIHLEISKPQKSSGKQSQQNSNRRSRSPEYGSRGRADRYTSGGRGSKGRERDGYRHAYRSPSPRNYRDRYDEPARYRTSSRSPGYRDRYRSPGRDMEDDLPLPRRQARDVPDVQIIALDQLDRDFMSWVEQHFTSRGVRVDILILSPRLNEEAVVRRQIVEGVVAVSKLRRHNQDTAKIGLTIFKRKSGTRDVQFEEYDNLEPNICVELVLREKAAQNGPPAGQYSNYPQYGAVQYAQQQHQQQQPTAPPPPPPPQFGAPPGFPPGYGAYNAQYPTAGQPPPRAPLPHMTTNMDPNNLQNLLSTLNKTSPTTPQTAVQAPSYGQPSQSAPGYAAQQASAYGNVALSQDPYAAYWNNQSQAAPSGPPSAPNMQDILARLGTYHQ